MADTDKLRKSITEILDGADLNTITAKKVRQQLEETLKLDLSDRRKEIDSIVMDIVNERQAREEEEESEEEEKPTKKAVSKRRSKRDSESEEEADDYSPAKKSKGKKGGSDSDDDWKGNAKRGGGAAAAAPAKGAKKGGGGTGYTKTCRLSPELARVMGEEAMARHEVVKKMWKIIKEKNLYDPKNKQFAICNEDLLPVFGVKRFRTFGMMKYLKNHFTD